MRIFHRRRPVTRIGPAKPTAHCRCQWHAHNHYTQAVTAPPAKAIDWHAFLARPRLPAPSAQTLDQLRDSSILVTGAGGSIGSALSLRLAALRPRRLLLLDASEQALYRLQVALEGAGYLDRARLLLGNCNNPSLLDEILKDEQTQLIFHAAAYKHVPMLEQHPIEAIANNALATLALAGAVARAGPARIVLLSTDKAAAPVSILGATKRIAERIVLTHNGVALRLGNVLCTEGSASEIFTRQIDAGVPITVTTEDAERYFLTCAEAVDLLLASAIKAPARSLLAPQLPHRHRITQLASFLSNELSPGRKPAIVFTGQRSGDKHREVFWSSDEDASASVIDGLLKITQRQGEDLLSPHSLDSLGDAVRERNLGLAMASTRSLVPNYIVGETVLDRLILDSLILNQLTQCEVRR